MSATSEHYVLSENEAEPIWFLGTLATVKAATTQTGGALSVVEFTHPSGFAVPRHIHHTTDEAFYILEGAMRGFCGDQTWHATPGSFVWLQRGIPHGYAVDGDASVLGDHPACRLRALRRGGGRASTGADLAPARGAGRREAECCGRQGRDRTLRPTRAVGGGRSHPLRVGDRHREVERLVGASRAYSPECVETRVLGSPR